MKSFLVTPKYKKAAIFLRRLLSELDSVKQVQVIDSEITPFTKLSVSSLLKEWESEEDKIWDNWAKHKIK